MRSPVVRLLPAFVTAALLVFAAFAGGARPGRAASDTAQSVNCAAGQLTGTDMSFTVGPSIGIRQPFDGTVPVAACTLGLSNAYTNARFAVRFWDPLTLAPAAGEIALRSYGYDASTLLNNALRVDFSPPLVTMPAPDIAEGGRVTLALEYQNTGNLSSQTVQYWSAGHDGMPQATAFNAGGNVPIPGILPVIANGICTNPAYSDLRVVQSVVATDFLTGFSPHDVIQRFRVPSQCEVNHVELAFGLNTNTSPQVGHVAIVDAAGLPDPPPTYLPAPLAGADFAYYLTDATWATHYDFGKTITLYPNHDYFLWVYTAYTYSLYTKHRTGGESIPFYENILGLYSRTGPFQAWNPYTGYALDFRIIGRPVNNVSVPPVAVARGLRLVVEPNPSPGAATLRWSGAREGARLEVIDLRGRRVAQFDGAGADGGWRWGGAGDRGESLPAGIYFVRATDREGSAVTARLVLVR